MYKCMHDHDFQTKTYVLYLIWLDIIPIVVSALGSVSKCLKSFLELLNINTLNVYLLQDCIVRNSYHP